MGEVATALGIVLGALVVLRAGLEWSGLAGRSRRRTLRVIESLPLGSRRRLHLVEVAGERLLVGECESGVALLRTLPESQDAPAEPEGEAAPAAQSAAPSWWRLGFRTLVPALLALLLDPATALAQEAAPGIALSLDPALEPERLSSTLEVLAIVTLVSVAPSILLMATCFTRIVIVLALLRQAIGVQHLPPNQVLVGLALLTTFFVMAPVGDQIRVDAYEPYVAREIALPEAADRAVAPVRRFLSAYTHESDLALFLELSGQSTEIELAELPLTTLLPAFMLSELRAAFEIGFMVYLPFLVVDLVIASMLISMGMIVLPPIVISLPFKLMLFVLLDGWNLVLSSLIAGLR